MSRHRDVRCMNYSEEYEGYDDVYGHSVEDDYCVSPSAEQFLFDRSKQQNIASFIMEPDIVEDNEDDEETAHSNEKDIILTELDNAKLVSCMESIKNIIGDTVPDSKIKKTIIQTNFDVETALNSILKESSPKTVKQQSAIAKDTTEHYPDATSVNLPSSSFNIPKFSFQKQNNIENTTANATITHSLQSLKNLNLNDSPLTFSSLSDLITNHTKLSSHTTKECQSNSNTVLFNSLADLTAHHLQKSNNTCDNTNSNEKVLSSTNFVIPKLSIKKDKSNDLNSIKLDLPAVQVNANIESDLMNDKKQEHSMDLLERSISDVLAFSKDNSYNYNKLYNLETEEDLLINVSDTRTPSPDIWLVDLSSALKEATSSVSKECNFIKPKISENVDTVLPHSKLHTYSKNTEIPYVLLPTTLNLSCLDNTRLAYTKRSVSLFGRTLCRTWKSRKPILKSHEQRHTVKRFDFSVPYSRN